MVCPLCSHVEGEIVVIAAIYSRGRKRGVCSHIDGERECVECSHIDGERECGECSHIQGERVLSAAK